MGRVCVSSCRCCVFVVHPVAILSVVFSVSVVCCCLPLLCLWHCVLMLW